jgi:hypothetical protein
MSARSLIQNERKVIDSMGLSQSSWPPVRSTMVPIRANWDNRSVALQPDWMTQSILDLGVIFLLLLEVP